MAKDTSCVLKLDDLSDAEIAKIEAEIFCAGGPPTALTPTQMARACAPTAMRLVLRPRA